MRKLSLSETFKRRLYSFLKQHRELDAKIEKTLHALEIDVRSPSLQTHKLHGKMRNFYTCSINYQYRIVFEFDDKFVYPDSIGSHDDVY